jgi:hypothetical protein
MRSTMIKCLRALKKDHELLLSTMQVFVLEPSLDWQENAAKLAQNFGDVEGLSNDSDPTGTALIIIPFLHVIFFSCNCKVYNLPFLIQI